MTGQPGPGSANWTAEPPLVMRPSTPAEIVSRPAAATVVMPIAISLDWPEQPAGESLIEALSDGRDIEDPDILLLELPNLLSVLEIWHRQGAAVLAPWSLRILDGRIAAWCAPGMGSTVAWPEPLRLATSHGPSADLHTIGMLLHRLAAGRWAESPEQAVIDAGVLGGEWRPGTDLAIISSLHPDQSRRARTAGDLLDRLDPFLRAAGRHAMAEGTRVQVADESLTGWTKVRGRPEGDNEDAAAWDWTPDGVVAAVLDGVSGAGDGGGRWASVELRRRLRSTWRRKTWDPTTALDTAVRTMAAPPRSIDAGACTVGVVVRIGRDRLEWASVGDCRLYLARPRAGGVSISRLSAEDSLIAEALRAGRSSQPDEVGAITNALPQPHHLPRSGSTDLYLGDIVVLVSDGACAMPAEEQDVLDAWRYPDVLGDLITEVRFSHAPLLVSRLCRRSEELGGEDNATALVIVCGPVPEAVLNGPGRRRSRLVSGGRPLISAD